MSMMLVTHDLGVVAGRTDEIAVMYAGQDRREGADAGRCSPNMRDALHRGAAEVDPEAREPQPQPARRSSRGRPPDLINPPKGCRFAPRCPYAQDRCREEEPPLREAEIPGHQFACWYPVGSPEGQEALERNRRSARPDRDRHHGSSRRSPSRRHVGSLMAGSGTAHLRDSTEHPAARRAARRRVPARQHAA